LLRDILPKTYIYEKKIKTQIALPVVNAIFSGFIIFYNKQPGINSPGNFGFRGCY